MMATANLDVLQADPVTIAAFLREYVGDPIHLVSIVPDGDTEGRWFADKFDAATAWAVQQNALGRGVYWTVNVVAPGIHKKPSGGKADMENYGDIVGQRFLHVDIDPPKDGSHFSLIEAQRTLGSLQYPPSFTLATGGGLGAFWRLDDTVRDKRAVTMTNKALERLLRGDNCHNHDRLMRVPGTVNYPNAKKRAAGRKPAMAAVLEPDDGVTYPLQALVAAYPLPFEKEPADKKAADVSDDVRLLTADDLGLDQFSALRSLIERPTNRDRSDDAFSCAGRMHRDGYSDAQIYGVLMNPANAVSAHILDQRDPRYQATNCIENSRPEKVRQKADNDDAPAAKISATPYQWRDPATIPLRPWVYGRWFLRGTVACVVAPGGVGKSTMLAGTALALATARPLLGKATWEGPKRVWLWNLEDDLDEMSRAIQSAAKHYGISREDIADKLFVDSAMEGSGLCTATEVNGEFRILSPVYEALTAELIARKIDLLVVDPFVSSHEVEENANTKIDKIAKAWGRVAKAANCVIVLVHHTSKAGSGEVTAMSARGAVALINAARSTLVLNRMDKEQAERLGIPDDERRRYFSVEDDKHNRAPAEKAEWYKLASVDLGNGPPNALTGGDSVGVAEPWKVPDPFDDVRPGHLLRVQQLIDAGEYRESAQSPEWAGKVVATVLDLNPEKPADKSRIKQLLSGWLKEGALKIEERADKKRETRKWIVVGRWLENTFAALEKGAARQGTAVEQPECPTTPRPPMGRGGAAGWEEQEKGAADLEPGTGTGTLILAPGEWAEDPVPGWNEDKRPRF